MKKKIFLKCVQNRRCTSTMCEQIIMQSLNIKEIILLELQITQTRHHLSILDGGVKEVLSPPPPPPDVFFFWNSSYFKNKFDFTSCSILYPWQQSQKQSDFTSCSMLYPWYQSQNFAKH